MEKAARYIILPARGLQARAEPQGRSFLASLQPRIGAAVRTRGRGPRMRVLDSIHENGAKLIEALPSDIPALRNSTPGVRIIPEVFYFPAVVAPPLIARRVKLATAVAPSVRIELNVVDARTGAGVRGATVVAFTDLATETGAQGTTNAHCRFCSKNVSVRS